jgi:hypothetical protein
MMNDNENAEKNSTEKENNSRKQPERHAKVG